MKLRHMWIVAIAVAAASGHAACAQEMSVRSDAERPGDPQQPCMAGMQMPRCPDKNGKAMQHNRDAMIMHPENFLQYIVSHSSPGTSAEPISTPVPMLMMTKGPWMLMFHANVFVLDEQQSSPRGGDKFFSTNWFMPMAQRKIGPGVFTTRVMLSLEPATVTARRYPLLLQQGETAFGVPIADGQHPHDFLMELAALYDLKLGEKSLLSFYFAPTGDPAIGPTAYSHRAS
ncbi:MAG TPA: hypothetical protein VNB49_15935, partial [Candidatus Dormibacteraeota bacterium]|nr:hypothetical protein [Candidatus Dormibacteraeota bacterium]